MSEFTQRIRSAIDNEMHGPGEPWEHALKHRIKALVIEAEYWNEIPETEQPQSLREHANEALKP